MFVLIRLSCGASNAVMEQSWLTGFTILYIGIANRMSLTFPHRDALFITGDPEGYQSGCTNELRKMTNESQSGKLAFSV